MDFDSKRHVLGRIDEVVRRQSAALRFYELTSSDRVLPQPSGSADSSGTRKQ